MFFAHFSDSILDKDFLLQFCISLIVYLHFSGPQKSTESLGLSLSGLDELSPLCSSQQGWATASSGAAPKD